MPHAPGSPFGSSNDPLLGGPPSRKPQGHVLALASVLAVLFLSVGIAAAGAGMMGYLRFPTLSQRHGEALPAKPQEPEPEPQAAYAFNPRGALRRDPARLKAAEVASAIDVSVSLPSGRPEPSRSLDASVVPAVPGAEGGGGEARLASVADDPGAALADDSAPSEPEPSRDAALARDHLFLKLPSSGGGGEGEERPEEGSAEGEEGGDSPSPEAVSDDVDEGPAEETATAETEEDPIKSAKEEGGGEEGSGEDGGVDEVEAARLAEEKQQVLDMAEKLRVKEDALRTREAALIRASRAEREAWARNHKETSKRFQESLLRHKEGVIRSATGAPGGVHYAQVVGAGKAKKKKKGGMSSVFTMPGPGASALAMAQSRGGLEGELKRVKSKVADAEDAANKKIRHWEKGAKERVKKWERDAKKKVEKAREKSRHEKIVSFKRHLIPNSGGTVKVPNGKTKSKHHRHHHHHHNG